MECNKEEALRAKGIAESKMQNKDFVGARKIVLKAQQLYVNLENISQMLTVCDVHCSAQIKVNGETDWYGILQVESTADDVSIKKQYRKLALLLHPDKNKFSGAEAAFKLIGEAQRILSDQAKRSLHDKLRGSNIGAVQPRCRTKQSNRTSLAQKQPGVSSNAANNFSTTCNGLNHQPSAFSNPSTFWTMCPFCGLRYQYYEYIKNRQLRCQTCLKTFIALDLTAQVVPPVVNSGYSSNHSGIPQQVFPGPYAHCSGQQSYFGSGSSGMWSQRYVGGEESVESHPDSGPKANIHPLGESTNMIKEDAGMNKGFWTCNSVKFEKVKLEEVYKREHVVKTSAGNANRKRCEKITTESSDAKNTDGEAVMIKGRHVGQTVGTNGNCRQRRSSRQKQSVSYKEEESNDDFLSPKSKRSKKGKLSGNMVWSDGLSSRGVEVNYGKNFAFVDDKDDKMMEGIVLEEVSQSGIEQVMKHKLHESKQGAGDEKESLKADSSSLNHRFDSRSKISPHPISLSYPDPEFHDFKRQRDANQFAANQIWAIYDNLDGMPRFYAQIRKVYGPDFKLHFTWLELVSLRNKDELVWLNKKLPVACGNFKLGKSEYTQDRLMFSNCVHWRKGVKRDSYDIYPRKGEVWALFKEWDIRWSSDADSHRFYKYEVVQVMSDYLDSYGICVIPLVKVEGFVSLFMPAVDKGTVPLQIPPHEILRFSHLIPSYRMTGEEREGIPIGSFELDSASLPSNFREIFPSIKLENSKLKGENLDTMSNSLHLQSTKNDESTSSSALRKSYKLNVKNAQEREMQNIKDLSSNEINGAHVREHSRASKCHHVGIGAWENVKREEGTPKQKAEKKAKDVDFHSPKTNDAAENHIASSELSTSTITFEYPDSEFHNFEEERSIKKFQCGQIWALYSDINRFPNYFGRIKKVKLEKSKVYVTWLDPCPIKEMEKSWWNKQLPVGCGVFQTVNDSSVFYTTDTFSHIVHAKPTGKKDRYEIYPSNGEIWAVFKNWSSGWETSDFKNCEYEVVEVLGCTDFGIEVLVLSKVYGYRAVFKHERNGVVQMEIPVNELLRFSHRIPAFRLTEEKGSKLRGCWELDPASLPDNLLINN